MKYIIKGNDPKELKDWKSSDKMYKRGIPKWDRVPSETKKAIIEALKTEQGYLCCYCERELIDNESHIEHIKPQGINEYKIFLAEYDNLLCSCLKDTVKGEPRHCGMEKKHWYDEALYVSPLDPRCEGRFTYSFDGHINSANENDSAALTTISKCKLDLDKLNALRSSAIEPFLEDNLTAQELNDFVNGYLVDKTANNGKFNPFFTTIKFLFQR